MKLTSMVVADPKLEVAQQIAERCDRLAEKRATVSTADDLLREMQKNNAELVVLSLELAGQDTTELLPKILDLSPDALVVATYRELSVPKMEKLNDKGIQDFVEQPVDVVHIYRAASRRFRVPFRRHDRFAASLEVFRADGVLVGKSLDVSEGGMQMVAFHPMTAGESILVDVALAGGKPLRLRCHVLHVDGQPPMQVVARMQFANLWEPEQKRLTEYLRGLTRYAAAHP